MGPHETCSSAERVRIKFEWRPGEGAVEYREEKQKTREIYEKVIALRPYEENFTFDGSRERSGKRAPFNKRISPT
jgi:hypothetical protein